MEALSPTSAGGKGSSSSTPSLHSAGRGSQQRSGGPSSPASPHAPSILVPLRFMVTGLLALVTAVVLIGVRPEILSSYHYNQYVIATTHLVVLGWIATIVMGAMYQLVPVALETKLYSERLARWQFVVHVIGFAGMVWTFWRWDLKNVGHFGTLLGIGVLLFAYNLTRTLLRVARWNVIASSVTSALVWLLFAVLAGLTITAGKCSYESTGAATGFFGPLVGGLKDVASWVGHFDQIAAMHAHAHLGAVGVFLMLIVGISYKLIPMFTLSEVQSARRAGMSVLFLNAGLLGTFFAVLTRSPLKPVAAGIVLTGLVLYGLELAAIVRARKRRALDWGVKYFLTGTALLAPLGALGMLLSWKALPLTVFTGQLENLYGFLAFFGVITFAIIGMLYKILPFLIWYSSYSRLIGGFKVPALADLYSVRVQQTGYWAYVAALATTSAGILLSSPAMVRVGVALFGTALLMLGLNISRMLKHLVKPVTQPLAARRTQATPISNGSFLKPHPGSLPLKTQARPDHGASIVPSPLNAAVPDL